MSNKVIASIAATLLVIPCFASEDYIPVLIPETSGNNGGITPHAPTIYLVQGQYDTQSCILSLSFLASLGDCTITVSNTAEELFEEEFDSDFGTCTMVLSGTPGFYTVSVLTGTGVTYSGSFTVF